MFWARSAAWVVAAARDSEALSRSSIRLNAVLPPTCSYAAGSQLKG